MVHIIPVFSKDIQGTKQIKSAIFKQLIKSAVQFEEKAAVIFGGFYLIILVNLVWNKKVKLGLTITAVHIQDPDYFLLFFGLLPRPHKSWAWTLDWTHAAPACGK